MGENDGGAGGSFEERLRAARARRGLGVAVSQEDKSAIAGMSPWGIGLRVGMEMVVALVVSVGIGWMLDRWLGTRPIFLAIFVLLGGAAGVLNVWRLFAPR